MTQRATLTELLDFANKVRAAGGGNPLDALMPAVPEDASQCLIARNLNFNCRVEGWGSDGSWAMFLSDPSVACKIADAIGVEPIIGNCETVVPLPTEIGQVAAHFDAAGTLVDQVLAYAEDDLNASPTYAARNGDRLYIDGELSDKQRAYVQRRIKYHLRRLSASSRRLLADLAPYVEASCAEAREIATFVNPDGSIVR